MVKTSRTLLLTSAAVVALSVTPHTAMAGPQGGVVVGGSANISQSGTKTDIHQHSNKAILDWRSFDIGAQEHVEFHQPSSNAMALNRIRDTKPSQIDGKLTANGHVMLINPNGVVFGSGSQVDVGSLTATTADIDNNDFMNGNLDFNKAGKLDGAIINEGSITVKEAGLVNLVAPRVENHGVIAAKLGKIQLTAADTFTLDMAGDGLLQVAVTDEQAAKLARNTGRITAEGGTIALTASRARTIVDSLVDNAGIIEAHSMTKVGGKVILGASDTGITTNRGVLNASGRKNNVQGGQVNVLGQHIAIAAGSLIDVSGQALASVPTTKLDTTSMTADGRVKTEDEFLADERRGGGSIKVGGDYLGTDDTPTAQTLYVDANTLTLNDGLTHGDGGRTIFWSDHTTDFNGLVLSRGGKQSGNGGFLETSGKINLRAKGLADLTPSSGDYKKGTYLLDPANITIYGNFDPTETSKEALWLRADDLAALVDGADIALWDNAAGNASWDAYQSILANRPTLESDMASQLNNLPVVRFNQILQQTLFTDIPVSELGNTGAFFFAIKPNGSVNPYDGLFEWRQPLGGILANGSGNNWTYAWDNGRWAWNGGPAISENNWQILSYNMRANSMSVALNGAAPLVDNAANPFIPNSSGDTGPGAIIGNDVCCANRYLNADIAEIIVFNDSLDDPEKILVDQYLSAKWNLALDPLAGSGAEAAEAMDPTNGFGVFTTDYLERLSATADIVLHADSTITLDLDGDDLILADDRSISLTTGNGNITDVSAGTIRTNRTGSGGNISITAGTGGNITLDTTNLEALGGGVVNLDAGGDINVEQASALNLGRVEATNISIESTAGDITGQGGIVTNGGTISVTSANDLNLGTFGLRSTNGAISLDAARDLILSSSTNAGTGTINATAGRDIFVNAHDLSTNLIGYWALDEGSGATTEDSISSDNDTLIGDATRSNDNPFGVGASLSLDGAGDYVSLGSTSLSGGDAFTLSAWLNTTTVGKYSGAVAIGSSAGNRSAYIGTVAGAQVGSSNSLGGGFYGYNIGSGDTTTNVWKHVSLTFSGGVNGTATIYIDGEAVQSATRTPNLNTTPAAIGRIGTDTIYDFSGLVDDVRIYDVSLSGTDIAQLYGFSSIWRSGTTTFTAGRDITLNNTIIATDSGNAIVLNAGRNFINNAGSGALNASDVNGRFLVYSSDPSVNTLGGLSSDFKRFNRTYAGYAPAAVTETGSGLFYSIAPTLNVTANDASRQAGQTNPTFAYAIDPVGLIDGDTLSNTDVVSGAPNFVSAGSTDPAGFYDIVPSLGTLTSTLGYQFTFGNGTLEITDASASNTDLPNTVQKAIALPETQLSAQGLSAVWPINQNDSSSNENQTRGDQNYSSSVNNSSQTRQTQQGSISADFISIDQPIIDFYDLCSYNVSYCE